MSGFGEAGAKPRRFYRSVSVELQESGRWAVMLDGRLVRTPAKALLALPSRTLADALAEEWDRQVGVIDAETMHLTRLANVALDRTPEARSAMAAEISRYAETDLVCHLAEGPKVLRDRQEAAWRPLREWAGEALGVLLLPVEGVMAARQPPTSIEAVSTHALTLDDFRLTGLAFGVGLFGSAVLALALERGRIGADEAFAASRLDEAYQAEMWGSDEEAAARTAHHALEAAALGLFLSKTDR